VQTNGDTGVTAGDRSVVRMFTRSGYTVRWETSLATERGLDLRVFGPGALRREYAFADAHALVAYQVEYERQLISNGYLVCARFERRDGHERRRQSRQTADRRKQ
jgi:hypothetical protein